MKELITLNISYDYGSFHSKINGKSTSNLINRTKSIGHQTTHSSLEYRTISNIPNKKSICGCSYSVLTVKGDYKC